MRQLMFTAWDSGACLHYDFYDDKTCASFGFDAVPGYGTSMATEKRKRKSGTWKVKPTSPDGGDRWYSYRFTVEMVWEMKHSQRYFEAADRAYDEYCRKLASGEL